MYYDPTARIALASQEAAVARSMMNTPVTPLWRLAANWFVRVFGHKAP